MSTSTEAQDAPRVPWASYGKKALILAAIIGVVIVLRRVGEHQAALVASLDKNPAVAAIASFAGGLLTAATPCVYPMIAITVSVFGARQAESRKKKMLLSTSFVLGIAAMFTPLVISAALAGNVFGTALANKWVVFGIAAIFLALAASMFGAFEMTLPDSMMQRLSTVGGIGYGGSFLLGLVSGVVAAPCTGPVLTGILLKIATTKSVALGALVGSSYALGLGVPFWLVGTFGLQLPKAGKWMLGVKSFFGILLIIVALHYLRGPVPVILSLAKPGTTFVIICGAAIVVGLALGAVHVAWEDGPLAKARKGLGIALVVAFGFFWFDQPPKPLEWEHSEAAAVAKAREQKRPLLVDFTATWCGACQEFSNDTFADPRVQAKLAQYVTVKVDASNSDDDAVDNIKDKYNVKGLPTVVLFDSSGKERKRFIQFVGPDPFLQEIDAIE